jgi:hypothetical protein
MGIEDLSSQTESVNNTNPQFHKTQGGPSRPSASRGKLLAQASQKQQIDITSLPSPADVVNDGPSIQSQLSFLFWKDYIAEGSSYGSTQPLRSDWTQLVSNLTIQDRALNMACSAIMTARIGRTSNNVRLRASSLELYGKALCELQRALWNKKRMYRDETLAATMVLSMYEVCIAALTLVEYFLS